MKSYAETEAPPEVRRVRDDVARALAELPACDARGEPFSCHALVLALAARYPELSAVHGSFGSRGLDHSWLIVGGQWVLDPHPVYASTGGAPLLLWLAWPSPWRKLYIEHPSDAWGSFEVRRQTLAALAHLDRVAAEGGAP